MRILVTGGAGFIGSNFVKHIMRRYPDHEILVLDALTYAGNLDNFDPTFADDPRFSFWYGNVTNADLVHDLVHKADAIVHFAAESHVARSIYDNSLFFTTDVIGTQTIANEVAKSSHIRKLIHISTSEVYGSAVSEPMDEDHPLNPMSPYAAAKAGADRLIYSYHATYGIPAVIVRPFNNYGPNQHLEKAVPRFITSALAGDPLTVHGDGEASRDWLFVEDTCEAIDLLLHAPETPTCEVYNLGTGIATSVSAIAEKVCDILGRDRSLITHIGDRPGQVAKHIADAGAFGERFGWKPAVGFDEGLRRTIEWYAGNEEWWRRLEWMKHVPVRTASGAVEYH
ncbi:MAG TPA: dTDP-glucose 4,6-dehydratase [Coriobacteriia bacterium]|jgi:dTDP-glucose 4,6-dehydratase